MILEQIGVHPEVTDEGFKRALSFPPQRKLEGEMAEIAAWARSWYAAHGRPWWCADIVDVSVRPGSGVVLYGETFGGEPMGGRFVGATGAAVIAASAGPEAEAEAAVHWEADEPDRYYFLECYAAAVVHALLEQAHGRLAEWAGSRGLEASHPYCPGYPDWTVGDAPRLLERLRERRRLPGVLDTLSSGMLKPKKSQLAAVGFRAASAR
jgi:hypothetical protein